MRKKVLSLVLCVAMMASMLTIPALAAEPETTAASAAAFTDTANHWAATAIDRWTQYGIIKGEGAGKFNPDGNLTRGALATVLTNLLGLTKKAENIYTDLKANEWYADAVLKCTAAGIMKGDGVKANPEANITRQEAMVMLGRALGIQPAKTADLAVFTDADKVAPWAASYVTALTKGGIVSGVGDSLVAPLDNMNRASVMKILDKAISDYVNVAGTYDKIVGTGIVLVSAPSVVLKGNKIAGSLLIAEGVGDGEFTLDGTNVAGNTTVRGGGVHSFVIKGGSKLGDVTIARVDGAVRIVTSDGSTIETTYIDDGKDDVIMEGSFGNVSVAGEVPVTLKGADVKTVTATGKNADITVDKDSKVVTVATAQENTKITVAGTVTNVAATAEATGVSLNVAKGGTATSVVTAAAGSVIKNHGNVGALAVAKGAETVFAKGENTTKTNITAADKKDLSVTTIAAQDAKEAVAKAAADQLAAEQLAAAAKTDAEKAAAQAAADKAAADKAAADKAQTDSKKGEDKVKEETKVEEKPVTPPVVDEGGKIDPPKPVEPDKPKPPYVEPYTYVKNEAELRAAVANASKIKLSNDISVADQIIIERTLTLDLGGFTIIAAETKNAIKPSGPSANVTIRNGTIFASKGQAVAIREGGKATVEATATLHGEYGATVFGKGSVLNLYGTARAEEGKSYECIGISGNGGDGGTVQGTTINIFPGAVVTGGIYHPQYGTVNITGGDITGPEVLSIKGGVFNISGGTFHATGAFKDPALEYNNGVESTGACISITNNPAYAVKNKATSGAFDPIELNITGGTFTSDNGYALYYGTAVKADGDLTTADNYLTKMAATGATFMGNAGKGDFSLCYIPTGSTFTVPAGKTMVVPAGTTMKIDGTLVNNGTLTNNGTITGTGTVINAIDTVDELIAAFAAGGTYKLAAGNYAITAPLAAVKNITLKGAGEETTIITPIIDTHAITIVDGVTLNLEDVQLKVTGTGRGINSAGTMGALKNTNINLLNSKIDYAYTGRGISLGDTVDNTTNNSIRIEKSEIVCVADNGSDGENRGVALYKSARSKLDIIDSTITASHYALNLYSPALAVTISGSNITGYAAINLHGEGSTFNITNSTLTGANRWSGDGDNFSTIALGGTAVNNVLNITDTVITNSATGTAMEKLLGGGVLANHNTFNFKGTSRLVNTLEVTTDSPGVMPINIGWADKITVDPTVRFDGSKPYTYTGGLTPLVLGDNVVALNCNCFTTFTPETDGTYVIKSTKPAIECSIRISDATKHYFIATGNDAGAEANATIEMAMKAGVTYHVFLAGSVVAADYGINISKK